MDFEVLVEAERVRQDQKWGQQNHRPETWALILGEKFGEFQKAILEWDRPSIEKEIVQVAAVAKAAWESMKRNKYIQ